MRRNPETRCKKCMVHLDNCFCGKLTSYKLSTKLSLIIFRKEMLLPSNTAHVALKSLDNSQAFERGHKDHLLGNDFIQENTYQPLYLFPDENAHLLTKDFLQQFSRPINLIVPDGTWRQTKKIYRREPLLKDVPIIKISPKEKSIYPLRRQKFDEGLCTFEAIAQAMGVIESEEVQQNLMENFKIFLNAHLTNRMIFSKP